MPSTERRSIIALLTAMFASASAVVALTTALGKQVYDLTGSELALGLLGLAEFAPNALLVLITGTFADRYDRRRIVALSMIGQALVVAGLAWYAASDPTSAVPIFVLVVLFGIARAFGWPALRALPPDVVERVRIPWLTVRSSATFQAAMIVGPVLGGFLYTVGVAVPYVAVAVLLLAGAAVITVVRVHPATRALDELPSDEQIVADATLEVATEASDGGSALPTPAVAARGLSGQGGRRRIRVHPARAAAARCDQPRSVRGPLRRSRRAAPRDRGGAAGRRCGGPRLAAGRDRDRCGCDDALARAGGRSDAVSAERCSSPSRRSGSGRSCSGVTTSFAVAFAALVALSAADAISVFIRGTLVPLVTPVRMRGRVLAFEMVFIGASNELGAFESGVAGQLLGTRGCHRARWGRHAGHRGELGLPLPGLAPSRPVPGSRRVGTLVGRDGIGTVSERPGMVFGAGSGHRRGARGGARCAAAGAARAATGVRLRRSVGPWPSSPTCSTSRAPRCTGS